MRPVLGLYNAKATVLWVYNFDFIADSKSGQVYIDTYPPVGLELKMVDCKPQTEIDGVKDGKFCTINPQPHMWRGNDVYLESTALDFDEPFGYFERGFERIRLEQQFGTAHFSPRLAKNCGTPWMHLDIPIYVFSKTA